MSALPILIVPETLSSAEFLHNVAQRFPAIVPILQKIEGERLRPKLEAVLRDALKNLPYFPDIAPEDAAALADVGAARAEVIATELGWLSREIGWLRSSFQGAIFRQLSGSGRDTIDTARYYLALVARLFRLEYEVRIAPKYAVSGRAL